MFGIVFPFEWIGRFRAIEMHNCILISIPIRNMVEICQNPELHYVRPINATPTTADFTFCHNFMLAFKN